jgi:hypothetical protein
VDCSGFFSAAKGSIAVPLAKFGLIAFVFPREFLAAGPLGPFPGAFLFAVRRFLGGGPSFSFSSQFLVRAICKSCINMGLGTKKLRGIKIKNG